MPIDDLMMNNQSDREIYIKGLQKDEIVSVLNNELGTLNFNSEISEGSYLYLGEQMTVLINTRIQDGFISVFIKGVTKWSSDIELARIFALLSGVIVRCDPGMEYPEVSPYSNIFVEIEKETECLIEWE